MKARHDPTFTDDERYGLMKEINIYLMEQTPYISLPSYFYYRYAWPWVKNWYGEHNVGYYANMDRIWAVTWIDQDKKAAMGY